MRKHGRWPKTLSHCVRCNASRDAASYQARGLCTVCYRAVRNAGTLLDWPSSYSSNVALTLAQTIGATASAEQLGMSVELFRAYCEGKAIPAEVKGQILAYIKGMST